MRYLEDDYSGFVHVRIAVVGCREDCDDHRELPLTPAMHLIALILHLMGSYHRSQPIILQKLLRQLLPKIYRALPHLIILPLALQRPLLIPHRITPQKITKLPIQRHLPKPIQLINILNREVLRCWEAAMHTEETIVQDAGEWQAIEEDHDMVVDVLVVFVEA